MDYKEKYNKALERASKLRVQNPFDTVGQMVEHIFPELNESEDEKIRKELITHCRNTRCVTEEGAERIAKWIAWLEKQGEQKPILDFKASDWYVSKVDGKIHNMHHSVDKVEPKFEVGDWIVGDEGIFEITQYEDEYGYELTDTTGSVVHFVSPDYVESNYHLWTTQDAKDGDILSFETEDCEWILIYEKIIPSRTSGVPHDSLRYHVLLSGDELSDSDICAMVSEDYDHYFHPATKEQRDMLFNKLREVGTKWDSEKKQLEYVEL